MNTVHPLRLFGWSALALALLVPAIAMRFTPQVNWTAGDFVAAAVLLGAVGIGVEGSLRLRGGWPARAGAALAVLTAFGLIWVNMAVGMIGSERNDANLLYAGVLAIAVGGAFLARGRPARLAPVMVATAAAQSLIGVAAVAAGWGADGAAWPHDVIGGTALFTGAWLGAAALFRVAARL